MKIAASGQRSEVSLPCVALAKRGCQSSEYAPRSTLLPARSRFGGPATARFSLRPTAYSLQPTVGGLRAAFTLVELLVVISIIALLLGIIVPAYFSIREKAKYTKAKVTVKNLETAFKMYLDHYRVWPDALPDEGTVYEIKNDIFKLLRERVDDVNNKDGIAFYEFETTDPTVGALDAWSNTNDPPATWQCYRVRVDKNYDNKIDDLYRTVIVWSVGTNRSDGLGAPATKEGNIKSWD